MEPVMRNIIVGLALMCLLHCDSALDPSPHFAVLVVQPGPDDGKDTEIWNLPENSSYAREKGVFDITNFGDKGYFRAATWTYYRTPAIHRGYVQFGLKNLPTGCVIDSAYLFLYSETSNGQTQMGDNQFYLSRVTTAWEENELIWYNQPAVAGDSLGRDFIIIPPSASEDQDYTIDVTSFVRYWNDHPGDNHGLRLSLCKEEPLARAYFASSEFENQSRRPKLVVFYTYES